MLLANQHAEIFAWRNDEMAQWVRVKCEMRLSEGLTLTIIENCHFVVSSFRILSPPVSINITQASLLMVSSQ